MVKMGVMLKMWRGSLRTSQVVNVPIHHGWIVVVIVGGGCGGGGTASTGGEFADFLDDRFRSRVDLDQMLGMLRLRGQT